MTAVNQERWINSSIRGILRILFMIKRLPSQKDDLNTSLAGDAIGTLRRSSTMGFSIFRFFDFSLSLVSHPVCPSASLSVSQSTVRSVFGWLSVLTSVARQRVNVLIPRQDGLPYSVGFLSLRQSREGRA